MSNKSFYESEMKTYEELMTTQKDDFIYYNTMYTVSRNIYLLEQQKLKHNIYDKYKNLPDRKRRKY